MHGRRFVILIVFLVGGTGVHLPVQARQQSMSYTALRSGLISPQPTAHATGGERSVPLAFGLSAVVPGAGQAYNRQWVKATVAFAAELALVTTYAMTRQDGLDREAAFQRVAHQRWSPARYAAWANDYKVFLNEEHGGSIGAPDVGIPTGIDFSRPDAWSAADRMAVDELIAGIRSIEREAFHPETGAAFSHQLPGFAEQQYYELIGKYFQFAPGWDDYPDWGSAEEGFTIAIDPEHTGPGGDKPNVSETFRAYAKDHAKAQDVLRRASRMSIFFILNHVVAGIDAAVNAKLHNDRLTTSMGVATDLNGRPVAMTTLRLRF